MVGNPAFLTEAEIKIPAELSHTVEKAAESGRSAVLVAIDGQAAAALVVADTDKPEAPEVIAQLKQAYLDGELPTNDGNYPPSAETRARNRELVQAASPSWLAQTPRAPQTAAQQ